MVFKKLNECLLIFAVFAIPLFTLSFGLRKSPFEYTLSMIGNWFDFRLRFILWGFITAVLLFFTIYNIFLKVDFNNKRAYRFLFFSVLFLFLTVLTPTVYQEPIEQELRELVRFNFHGLFGVFFAVFLILSLFLFTKYLSFSNKKLYIKSYRWLLFCVGGSIFTRKNRKALSL